MQLTIIDLVKVSSKETMTQNFFSDEQNDEIGEKYLKREKYIPFIHSRIVRFFCLIFSIIISLIGISIY